MRVIINGRFLDQPLTGVQRFGREMIRAIAELTQEGHPGAAGLDIVVARPRSQAPVFEPRLAEARFGLGGGHGWEQTMLPLYARRSVILNFCNAGPVAVTRTITCFHDAHIWRMPENYSKPFLLWHRLMQPVLLRRGRGWTTVSNYSARALLASGAAKRPPDAITYSSGNAVLTVPESERAAITLAQLPERYVFALGSASVNKNMALLASIAPQLNEHGIAMLIAGGSHAAIFGKTNAVGGGVVQLGRVSDADLVLLYRHALAFLFPSFEEGFGAPPVEAMVLGCPVVASNTSALPEILGDAALLLPPTDQEAWIRAVLGLKADKDFRCQMIQRGSAQAARYTWRESALKFLSLARAAGNA